MFVLSEIYGRLVLGADRHHSLLSAESLRGRLVVLEAAAARRADAPRSFAAELVWRREGHLVARARSRFTTFSAGVEAKLMTRQYGQAPADAQLESA